MLAPGLTHTTSELLTNDPSTMRDPNRQLKLDDSTNPDPRTRTTVPPSDRPDPGEMLSTPQTGSTRKRSESPSPFPSKSTPLFEAHTLNSPGSSRGTSHSISVEDTQRAPDLLTTPSTDTNAHCKLALATKPDPSTTSREPPSSLTRGGDTRNTLTAGVNTNAESARTAWPSPKSTNTATGPAIPEAAAGVTHPAVEFDDVQSTDWPPMEHLHCPTTASGELMARKVPPAREPAFGEKETLSTS